jgi:hypothetical protein
MSEPVPIRPDVEMEAPRAPLPTFEGRVVNRCEMRIVGTTPLVDLDDTTVSVDDRVRMIGEYRVVAINHYTDPKTGDLVRQQVLKPQEATTYPWDPTDPKDDGVIRAVQA